MNARDLGSTNTVEISLLGPHSSHLQSTQEHQQTMAETTVSSPNMEDQADLASSTLTRTDSKHSIRKKSSRRITPALIPEDAPLPENEMDPRNSLRAVELSPIGLAVEPREPKIFVPSHLRRKSSREILTEPIMRERVSIEFIPAGLRRRVTSIMKMAGISLPDADSDRVKGLWNVFDVDRDGIIDYEEFCRYTCDLIELQKKKKTQSAMSSVEAKFVRIVIMEIKHLGTVQRAIESVFRMLDQNGSGRISQLEFEDGIRELGIMEFNFEVHGRKRRFADKSLFLFKANNRFRYCAVWIAEWKWFDRFILLCILLNSAMLAFRDNQDPGYIPDLDGNVYPNARNSILERIEAIFSWLFVAECALKIIAMGFLFGRGAYLRSYWNMLDFFVVVVGLIGDLPGVPKVSALRTARVLRPLRALSNLRGMRMLIYSLFAAIPALFNVMVILTFVFTVFGILGVLFWNGILYYRCRATPEPVNGVWALADGGRICGGAYTCPTGQYCGSVYDPPPGTFVDLSNLPNAETWDYATVRFDHIGLAVFTLFQCITLEGWTSVMYNMQDAHNYAFATIYFIVFTIIGAFFLLQFVFAVIWERFNAANDGTAGEWDLILEVRRTSAVSTAAVAPTTAHVPSKPSIDMRIGQLKKRKSSFTQSMLDSIQTGIVVVKRKNPMQKFRSMCRTIIHNDYFAGFIVLSILLNTVTLAMDEYPVNTERDRIAEIINMTLTFIFSLELVFKVVAGGWKEYRANPYSLVDGFIVLISVVELLIKFFASSRSNRTGLSALRSFRLFRIVKLARSWKSLRELLQTMANSVMDVANFGLLLVLLMYVFALIGMQFFANKYHFNADGDPVEWEPHIYNMTTPPHAPWTPERPYTIRRSNFDDIVGAFTTVFQCLTEENWNSVMADGVRSAGWLAAFYFLLVMVIGNIIILNLFLAILLGNFSVDEQQVETEQAVSNKLRQLCKRIIQSFAFELVMVVVICISSIQLSIDNPLNDPASTQSIALAAMDTVFTYVFLVEMVVKVIDRGFLFNGKTSYLRDTWNMLDFSILICSSITMFSSNKKVRSLRSLRALRALRPLRVISRVPGMRRVVNALLASIPSILNVFLVCILIFLIFGIIGVNLFKGRLFYCDMAMLSEDTLTRLEAEYGFSILSFKKLFSREDCLREGGTWRLNSRNYDNVLKSAMTLFELATTEGWVGIMYQGVDATEIGYHPVENWNRSYIVFFVVFIIIGCFFTMNLFVGAVIDNFNRMRESMWDRAECETQREWLQIQDMIRSTKLVAKLKVPKHWLRHYCFRIQQHPRFEALVAASVLGNTLMLAMTHFGQSPTSTLLLTIGNFGFWWVFLVEAIVKLMSLGHLYFTDRWNVFDFAVVVASTISTLLPLFRKGKISPVANTLRAFRMGLAIRLMKRAKSMQDIVNTILDNMPALVNVSTLLFLVMFVYAVIGVQLYAGVMLGDSLDEHANFQDVGIAMVTLFRFATGEAWNDVMYDLTVMPRHDGVKSCVEDYTYEQLQAARDASGNPKLTIGCTPGVKTTYMFFFTYQLITTYVLLNLFVAVILEGFEETTEKNMSAVTKDDFAHICYIWERYDPKATGYIPDHEFLRFLRDVPPPLGLPKHSKRKDIERWVKQLDLFLDINGKVSFNAFILSATQNVMHKVAAERGENIIPARGAESFFAKSQKAVRRATIRSRNSITERASLIAIVSATRIQALIRRRIARKRFLQLKSELAAKRISLYDQAAMSIFKEERVEDKPTPSAIPEEEEPPENRPTSAIVEDVQPPEADTREDQE
ncbi:hypothetical protein Poli38472_011103 [Pythium oligandrum]|uniref:EF-hand domain-containing protein n=1 Tax=Pythium oligandrum TaxID=41045 RepID=A0A8K1FRD6_PYTOL|nr:hypothetical protein Poli38472_011103 [Pythium oligandrum]|eukprot:TMW67483.1 hypothetical protein Poli38472_011103 [Pythium oligandrum]